MGLLEEEINQLAKKISDTESENMQGSIETIGDYGFKCAKAGLTAAFRICKNAQEIMNEIYKKNEDSK